MPKDEQTIAVYDEQAEAYLEFMTDVASDESLHRFLNRIPKRGKILDLGCGPGDYAAAMSALGYAVVATDASPVMAEMARKHPGVDAYEATFEDLDDDQLYDGVWANFSLLHSTRADFPDNIARVVKALKTDGVLHLAMKTGTSEDRDSLGRHYAYYSPTELHKILHHAGMDIVDEVLGESLGLSGDISPWVILTARTL